MQLISHRMRYFRKQDFIRIKCTQVSKLQKRCIKIKEASDELFCKNNWILLGKLIQLYNLPEINSIGFNSLKVLDLKKIAFVLFSYYF